MFQSRQQCTRLTQLRQQLRLPVLVAPMFLVSGPELTIAACKAGVVGSFPTLNARTAEELEAWLVRIDREIEQARQRSRGPIAPYAVNVVVREAGSPRFQSDLALIERYRPQIVITSVGQPGDVVKRIHAYGGIVLHDVATMRHAVKASEAGVDGLILLTSGAGGHTGSVNPFAFTPQVRARFSQAIVLAGCITDGCSILAAETLGADFAYMGTRFAATRESLASPAYKSLLVSQQTADVFVTDRISGMPATFMRGSIERVGLNPDGLPSMKSAGHPDIPEPVKAWRDIWSAGQGVGLIEDIPTVAELVDRLEISYRSTACATARGCVPGAID